MKTNTGQFAFLKGGSYEIGIQQARELQKNPIAKSLFFTDNITSDKAYFDMTAQIEQYCPGLNKELAGFAEGFGYEPNQLNFYQNAWLIPGGCSLGAILPGKMADGKTYVVRNYDLSPDISDMRLCTTAVEGKYTHTGFSVSTFGRSEGLNEKGLCVAYASCGMPIGKYPGMRPPAVTGLQFMVIVRALLENCKNVEEAIYMVNNMPVGTNMNLLLADASGDAALIGTYDGIKEVKRAELDYLIATNHGLFSAIQEIEPRKLEHSQLRYDILERKFKESGKRSMHEIQELLLTEFPKGLSVHNYKESFGTVHSILFNLTDLQLEFSFGSPLQNQVNKIEVGDDFAETQIPVECTNKNYGTEFWKIIKS
ncbi:linear amide C-N hydrolase [Lysinibacillus agricola]|uniref:Linear amide C-N hydrolase n=1 Tax=Lysinibacillus agricola TaxID=2590012 RepID=A0ABX7AMA0_9BACI|nr:MULTISPECIES: C45 family peptidase [Lysinibacillus]KOS62233.1 choloylglycine hydrolase [Lysinibacillus sp. FJAT-14222]QQP10974.1 linear amide C-N hydrolase [Lysinibacillus agricola]